jgi:short-chain Z-isoprenyl diphosphate synthase
VDGLSEGDASGFTPAAEAVGAGLRRGSAAAPLPAGAGVARRLLRRAGSVGALVRAPLYQTYTRRLRGQVAAHPLPAHVAVILDGNRRWAQLAGLHEPGAGHRRGADTLAQLIGWCSALGIGELTVWALSTENLTRGERERAALLAVLAEELATLPARAERAGATVRVRPFGRVAALPEPLAEAARSVEAATAANDGLRLNVALGYSGRDELVDAARALIASLAAAGVPLEEMAAHVDAEALAGHLYTAGHSDPDLIIRTSGEMRLSGFLPWQSSHSEFYFTDVYWPAFRELDFLRAVRTFQQRERRFGR